MREEFSKEKLKQIVDKICRIEEEKDAINAAIKDTLDEAKSLGFDTKAIKQVIKITKMDDSDVEKINEEKSILNTYLNALDINYKE